jgi:hypothetical protein
MSRQNGSPEGAKSSSHTVLGPVAQTFQHCVDQYGLIGTEQCKLVWYHASLQMYNLMVDVLRTNPEIIAAVTAAVKHDIDKFFEDLQVRH